MTDFPSFGPLSNSSIYYFDTQIQQDCINSLISHINVTLFSNEWGIGQALITFSYLLSGFRVNYFSSFFRNIPPDSYGG
jgi:hypothetical protein